MTQLFSGHLISLSEKPRHPHFRMPGLFLSLLFSSCSSFSRSTLRAKSTAGMDLAAQYWRIFCSSRIASCVVTALTLPFPVFSFYCTTGSGPGARARRSGALIFRPGPRPQRIRRTPRPLFPGRRTVRLNAPGKTEESQRQPQRLSAPQGRPRPVHLRTPSWRRSCRRSSRTGASPPGAPVAPGQRPPGQQARAADPARTGLSHRRGPAWRPPAAPR